MFVIIMTALTLRDNQNAGLENTLNLPEGQPKLI